MLLSLALIFLVGFSAAAICSAVRLPRIVGMIATGIAVGPYVLDWLDPSILGISSQLRQIALIIILIRAGLTLNLADLKKVGRPAVMMSFVPACMEILGYFCFAPLLLGLDRIEALLMVVPRMIRMIEDKRGTEKSIPQMILAGASCDDVFVIVLFSTFLTMAQGGSAPLLQLVNIPVSIALGVVIGAAAGFLLYLFFEFTRKRSFKLNGSVKVIIMLSVAFLLMTAETWLKNTVAVSGLLAVVAMACLIKLRSEAAESKNLSGTFGKLWIAAEVVLFVLVGAAVDIRYTLSAGAMAVAMIFIALAFRTVGVLMCMVKTPLSAKERLFCVIAYLPKATVQASIGAVPLSMGLPCGNMILSVAVLAILITAPMGAIGIDVSQKRLLQQN